MPRSTFLGWCVSTPPTCTPTPSRSKFALLLKRLHTPTFRFSMAKLSSVIAPFMATILLVVYSAEAFTASPRTSLPVVPSTVNGINFRLRASEGGDDSVGLPPLPSQKGAALKEEPAPLERAAVTPVSSIDAVQEGGASYPINLPSPLLLATSMVLAISSIGKEIAWFYFLIFWSIACASLCVN